MSSLDIINFLLLRDADRGSKNQDRLGDLRDRAAYIGKKTGHDPVSWYEFKQTSPREEPKTVTNMILGSAIGLAAGVVVGLVLPELLLPMAISAALLGAAAGAFSDTENTRRNSLVAKYEDYLDAFESKAMTARAPSQGINLKTTHGAEVLAERKADGPALYIS